MKSKAPKGSNFASGDSAGKISLRANYVSSKLTGFSANFSLELQI
jgi:hypothetical protein